MKKRWKITSIGMIIFLIAAMATAMLGVQEKEAKALSGEENGYTWFYTAVKGDPDSPATGVYLDYNENPTISSQIVVPEYFTDSGGARHYVESIGGSIGTDSFFVGFDTLSNITIDATNCTRLTTVNNCAIYDRTGITVLLPETVTTIGEDAFAGGSQNSVSCENPNIAFAGEDHTGTGFQFTGTSRSTAYERYNASGKFKNNGLSAFKLSLDANDDSTDRAEMGTGILQDNVYVFSDYGAFADKNNQENYINLSTLKSIPTRSHYTFEGFYTESEGGTQLINSEGKVNTANITSLKNTEDTTAFARWTPDRYTITFSLGEGVKDPFPEQTVTYGDVFDLNPLTFKRPGFTFCGWSESEGSSIPAYEDGKKNCATLQSDITLFAIWEEHSYTLSFDGNGGLGSMSSQYLKYSAYYTLPECTFARTNYTFLGWSLSKSTSDLLQPGTIVSGLTTEKDGEVTLYAVWEAKKYTVNFDPNGAEGLVEPMTVEYDQTFALPECGFTRSHYTFLGWGRTRVSVDYKAGEKVENLPAVNGEILLYAVWEEYTYTLSFNSNGGSGTIPACTLRYSQEYALPEHALTKSHYTFTGWGLSAGGKTVYQTGDIVSGLSGTNGGKVVLYAVWEPDTYTIRFQGNGADTGSMKSEEVRYDESHTLSVCGYRKEHYAFAGWGIKNADGTISGAVYQDGATVKNITAGDSITLYALWREYTYTIRFVPNGGSGAMTEQELAYSREYTLPECGFVRNNYTFAGWQVPGKDIMQPGDKVSGLSEEDKGQVDLCAVWLPHKYTVEFDGNGEDSGHMDSMELSYGQKTALTKNAYKKTGYTFEGWKLSADALQVAYTDGEEVEDMVFTSKITLYASWRANTYTIRYEGNGAEYNGVQPQTVSYGTQFSIENGEYMSKKGYKLIGWSWEAKNPIKADVDEETAMGSVDIQLSEKTSNLALEGELVLYAVWQQAVYSIEYDENAGEDEVSQSKEYITSYCYGDSVTFPVLSRAGYVFKGWQCGSTILSQIYNTDTGDIKLTAVWERSEYGLVVQGEGLKTIRIDGGVYEEEMKLPFRAAIGTLEVSTSNTMYISGYKVVDSSKKTIQEAVFSEQESEIDIPLNLTMPVGGLCIDVQTTGRTYAIRYDTDGGTIKDTYATSYVYGKGTDLPQDVYRQGMKFVGWTGADGIITSISGEEYGDVSLTAVYERAVYNLSIDLNGGNADGFTPPTSYRYDEGDIVLPENVVKEGYTFSGWYNDTVGDLVTKIDTTVEKDQYIYAKWHANNSTAQEIITITENGTEEDVELSEISTTEKNYYYSILPDIEKRIYTTLYDFYQFDMNTGICPTDRIRIISDTEFSDINMYNASAALIEDHPEIFWIHIFRHSIPKHQENGQYTCSVSVGLAYNKAGFLADASEYKGFFEEIIENLEKEGIDQASYVEKIKMIHDYVVTHYSYRNKTKILNSDTTDETRSVGYMMSHKEGCCVSYARMVKILCDYFNICVVTLSGGNHMWNGVLIDEKWYILDATWDDEGDKISYDYFLKGSDSVHDVSHVAVNNTYLNADGSPLTDFACPTPPEISREDYMDVSSAPMGTQTVKPTAAPTLQPATSTTPMGTQTVKPTAAPTLQPATSTTPLATPTINPVTVEQTTINGITYKRSGKTAKVAKASKKIKKAVIQKKVKIGSKRYKVTSIGKNAFKGCKKLKQVIVKTPYLKSVAKSAFKGCRKLKTVKVPKSCKKKYRKWLKKVGLGKIR